MVRHEKRLLLHPLFLLSLLLLILNDHLFKYEYPGWFTGKLSDITGLLVFVVFWTALFPRAKKQVYTLTVLFFLWWKSPLSNDFLLFCHEILPLPLQRVVDYSDYIALLILPLSWRLKPVEWRWRMLFKTAIVISGCLAGLAICATSLPPRKAMVDGRFYTEGKASKSFTVKGDEKAVIAALEAKGYKVAADSAFYKPKYNWYFTKEKDSLGRTYMKDWSKQYRYVYEKADYGKAFTLDRLVVKKDTIENIQFMLAGNWGINHNKSQLEIVSFQYKPELGTTMETRTDAPYERISPRLRKYFKKAAKR